MAGTNGGLQSKNCKYYKEDEFPLVRNQLITTLPMITKEYEVGFELRIGALNVTDWENVIHLTDDTNYGKYGDRITFLSIFQNRFQVYSAVDGNYRYYHEHTISKVGILLDPTFFMT